MPDEKRGRNHHLTVISVFGRAGQHVECSGGWASPDLQFSTTIEALEWAQKEHPDA